MFEGTLLKGMKSLESVPRYFLEPREFLFNACVAITIESLF